MVQVSICFVQMMEAFGERWAAHFSTAGIDCGSLLCLFLGICCCLLSYHPKSFPCSEWVFTFWTYYPLFCMQCFFYSKYLQWQQTEAMPVSRVSVFHADNFPAWFSALPKCVPFQILKISWNLDIFMFFGCFWSFFPCRWFSSCIILGSQKLKKNYASE